jgi:hypothetical protein
VAQLRSSDTIEGTQVHQENLSKSNNVKSFLELGWTEFVRYKRAPRDFHPDLLSLPHSAAPLLHSFLQDGVSVNLAREPTPAELEAMIARGSRQSAHDHVDFFKEEFAAMERKGHWV